MFTQVFVVILLMGFCIEMMDAGIIGRKGDTPDYPLNRSCFLGQPFFILTSLKIFFFVFFV
jgi:hypothetical protein